MDPAGDKNDTPIQSTLSVPDVYIRKQDASLSSSDSVSQGDIEKESPGLEKEKEHVDADKEEQEQDQQPDHAVERNDIERVKSKQPSVNNISSIPNGGLKAWLQVLGAFFLFFNSWYVHPSRSCLHPQFLHSPRLIRFVLIG
jgi:hypothetical protein